MYLQELRGEVSQGDIFDSLPIASLSQDIALRAWVENSRAMLLTYDCEYDKPSTKLLAVAEIFSLSAVPLERRGNLRKNQVFSTFYLAANAQFDEAFVDFRSISRIDKPIVAAQAQAGTRLISLSDDVQLALQEQLSAFFGYGRGR